MAADRCPAASRRPPRIVRQAGGESLELAADLHDHAALEALVTRVLAEWGGIDLLVNNAVDTGPGSMVPISVLTVGRWRRSWTPTSSPPWC